MNFTNLFSTIFHRDQTYEAQINKLLFKTCLFLTLGKKKIRQQHINNKLKTIAPTWTDEFE